MTVISMFDHRAIFCSIRVINSRCDILLDRSVVTHGFSRCGHNKLQYKVFCLLTVYLVVYSISHAGVTCQVCLLCYVLLYAVRVLFEFAIDTSRHRGRCAEKWQEHVRAGVCNVGGRKVGSRCSAQKLFYRACKSRARKRGWGQLGAGGPYTPC